ncbi:hypothetical protein ACQPZJ_26155 [Actinoplanes sp. CA-054009]
MDGWPPGRLNLAGPEPDLFGPVPAGVELTGPEREAVTRSRRCRRVRGHAVAYCCDAAGPESGEPRAFTGRPDAVVRVGDLGGLG